ncbi:MAG: phasin family protein [Synechococcus sp.]|nr:phasin family protein [Synechococcus sp.]
MDPANPLQQLLLRGLGTTTLVADRLRGVTQDWVSRGRLDPQQASALVDDVMKALRGETPELEEQMERNLERNRDNLLQDLGVASQKELDELRGRIDRLEQQLRQLNRAE